MSDFILSRVETKIFFIRGQQVMIDRDLAELYRVPTAALNQAVKRNKSRFPDNFMFRLNEKETRELITNCDRFRALKHATAAPAAFTEHGVAMLSSVLRSRRAIRINLAIIQAFIRLRRWALTHSEMTRKLEELERQARDQDCRIEDVFDALKRLLADEERARPRIGFRV